LPIAADAADTIVVFAVNVAACIDQRTPVDNDLIDVGEDLETGDTPREQLLFQAMSMP
jgi:hypothetical protein